ncbi:MAG: hypothetical protein ACK528_15190 [Alphaproteobacteria bacterium]|jgi:hypothetical protein
MDNKHTLRQAGLEQVHNTGKHAFFNRTDDTTNQQPGMDMNGAATDTQCHGTIHWERFSARDALELAKKKLISITFGMLDTSKDRVLNN